MKLNNRTRYPYWFLAGATGAAAMTLAFVPDGQQLSMLVAIIGAVGALVGFLYSEHREETRLFMELFTGFNRRYDRMNGRVWAVKGRPNAGSLTADQVTVLIDYFNLCAEEFLFYQAGYIDESVWRAWCRGMKQYLNDNDIRRLFEQELLTDSYYGLSVKEIERGASS